MANPEYPYWIILGKSRRTALGGDFFDRVQAQSIHAAEAEFTKRYPKVVITSIAKEVEWRP